MAVCDALEVELRKNNITLLEEGEVEDRFDRVAYQREYMRQWRARRQKERKGGDSE